MDNTDFEHTSEVGCASHFSIGLIRDEIIDEIITGIEFEGLRSAEEIWRMVESLRTQSEAHR